MEFYKSIAPYYEYIFPYNPIQKDFILSTLDKQYKDMSVLEIGCGTGNLSLELSRLFKYVIGIDSDLEMIRLAKSKMKRYGNNINFKYLNMIEIKKYFSPSEFDLIVSFGNTLVHLKNSEEINDFLRQSKKMLNPGGKLLLQIVNFDRILENNIQNLRLIENEYIKFERYYIYHRKRRILDFETILTVKKEGRIIKNSIQLYPLIKKEINNMLRKVGYRKIFFYGSFKKERMMEKSIPLIIEAY